MSEIDPQEFGHMKAQITMLIKANEESQELLRRLAADMTAVRLQLAEARGGWKLALLMGGAAASFGGIVSWAFNHLQLR